ncbi:hypothetical protein [Candidatus Avelusimicrobium sp.]|uniref:hypothetical protein n=1 Tax=Candidatus Avelusimicrobium sp. TaxID=3048833 RepID=UPI003D7C9A9E
MFAKIVNQQTKEVQVVQGAKLAQILGAVEMDVEQAYNGAWYVKGYAPSKPEPTTEQKVQALENETGLTRAVRELVLADGSGASDYVRAKAQEIEALANPLRSVANEIQKGEAE